MQDLISVVVPVYGVEQYLDLCIERLTKQTYKKLEIILIDDGSKDSSGMLCDKWAEIDDRIIVIHQNNRGLSGARNSGLKVATGNYVAFVDSDDYVELDFIELLHNACVTNKCQMAIANYNIVDSEKMIAIKSGKYEGKTYLWSPGETLENKEYNPECFIANVVWNKLYARQIISNIRFPEGQLYEDVVYTYDAITRANRVAYIDKPLYNYRVNRSGSIMNSTVNFKRLNSDLYPLLNKRSSLLRSRGYLNIADHSDYTACETLITNIEVARYLKDNENLELLNQWFDEFYSRCPNSTKKLNRVTLYRRFPYIIYTYDSMFELARRIYRFIKRRMS